MLKKGLTRHKNNAQDCGVDPVSADLQTWRSVIFLQWLVASSKGSDWRLQSLTAGDAPFVLDLLRVAFATTEVPLNPPPGALSETVDSLETQILRGGGAGANSGERLIGSVLWTVADGLYVSRIAVSPEWRRCGIASALLAACDDEAGRRGQRRLHLETRLVLAGNLRLFARFGYREFARLPPAGDPQKTLIKLEKWIG